MATFTYPLDIPSYPAPTNVQTSIAHASGITTSPFSNIEYSYSYNRYKYIVGITLPPMKIEHAKNWYNFFQKLKGSYGTFLMPDYDYSGAQNASLTDSTCGTTYESASAGENEIGIDTSVNLGTDVFQAGDKVQIGTGLYARTYVVADDVDTDGTGRATITVTPDFDINILANTTVFVDNPKHLFRLTSEPQSWSSNHIRNFGISFTAESTSKGSPT